MSWTRLWYHQSARSFHLCWTRWSSKWNICNIVYVPKIIITYGIYHSHRTLFGAKANFIFLSFILKAMEVNRTTLLKAEWNPKPRTFYRDLQSILSNFLARHTYVGQVITTESISSMRSSHVHFEIITPFALHITMINIALRFSYFECNTTS